MQIERTENELIIRETPGCLWIFGLFFAIVGGIFVYGALGGLSDYDRQPFWTLAAAFVMGSVGVAAGVWIIYGAPITKLVIDRIQNEVQMTRYGLFGRRETVYTFAQIEQFRLIEEADGEGSPIWSLAMNLSTGETVKISSHPSHDERFKLDFAFQVNEFMRKQISPAQMILTAEDEPDEEMR